MKETVNASSERQGKDAFFNEEKVRPEILVPLDLTPCSREAVHAAVPYAQRLHARIILLHVLDVALDFLNATRVDVPRIEHQIREQVAAEFAWATSTYKGSGVSFETLLIEGLPAEQILNTAQERNVLLIVMGKHPKPKRWSLFHRQTVKEVMENAPCEVIILINHNNRKSGKRLQEARC